MSSLLLAQQEERQSEERERDDRDRGDIAPKVEHPERLGEDADRDRLIPGRRKRQPEDLRCAGQGRTGANSPEKFTAGTIDKIAVANTAATCVRTNEEMSCPNPVVANT